MVITSRILSDRFGIDEEIADYFANKRPVPENNLYWDKKRIYIAAGFGYLIIPIAFDLMFKQGISKKELLNEEHLSLMEAGFHLIQCYEKKIIGFHEFVFECKKLLNGRVKQNKFAEDVFALLTGEQPRHFHFDQRCKALTRGDSFLLTLIDLDITDDWIRTFLPFWYALVKPILLLDDFKDLYEDRIRNDENAIIEMGNDGQAILNAYQLGITNSEKLAEINPNLADLFKGSLNDSLNLKYIQAQLANQ